MSKIKTLIEKIRHSYYDIMKILSFVLTLVIVVLLMPRSVKFKYEYQKMRPWQHETLYAPFNFPIYKSDEQVRSERDEALKKVELIFVFDALGTENGRDKLLKDFEEQWNDTVGNKDFYRNMITEIYDKIENTGVVAKTDRTNNFKGDEKIVVVRNKIMTTSVFGELYTMATASKYIHDRLADIDDYNTMMLINNLLHSSLRQNVIYSENMTKQAEKMAIDNIMLTFGMVQKDELVIMEGEIVTDEKYQIINSLQKEYADITSNNFFSRNYLLYGQLLLVSIVFLALYLTLRLLRPDIFNELRYINLILLLMLFTIIPSFLLLKYAPSFIFLMPVAIMSILLMTFFDARVSIIVQVMTLIIISLAVPNPFQYFFVQMLVSFVAVFAMMNRGSRASYFGTSLAVFVTYVVVYLGMMLIFDGDFTSFSWSNVAIYAGN